MLYNKTNKNHIDYIENSELESLEKYGRKSSLIGFLYQGSKYVSFRFKTVSWEILLENGYHLQES